jgi:hypothetical protein
MPDRGEGLMRDTFCEDEIPAHLRDYFAPVGGGDGVAAVNSHPT